MDNIDIRKSVNDFINRQIYKHLSPEILASIPDDKLEQAVVDYVTTKLSEPRNTLADVSILPTGFQIVYSTWVLEGEVNNGGFNQFFVNSSGQFADMALLSLKKLGALQHYVLLEKAIVIHDREKKSLPLRFLYSLRTLQAFLATYKYSSLDKCDEQFYELGDSLSKLRIQYIRANPGEFVGN
jgi:hypothetical protein